MYKKWIRRRVPISKLNKLVFAANGLFAGHVYMYVQWQLRWTHFLNSFENASFDARPLCERACLPNNFNLTCGHRSIGGLFKSLTDNGTFSYLFTIIIKKKLNYIKTPVNDNTI